MSKNTVTLYYVDTSKMTVESVEARETEKQYRFAGPIGAYSYRAQIAKDDDRAFLTPASAIRHAIEQATESVDYHRRQLARFTKRLEELRAMLNGL